MKLTDIMTKPLDETLKGMPVTKLTPIADDCGKIIKIIVEYTPPDIVESTKLGLNRTYKN